MVRHIAIVANTTWNIYQFRLNVVDKLSREGWKISIIAPLDQYISYTEMYPKVEHIPLYQLSRSNTNPWKELRIIHELKAIYRQLQPDIILHYTHKPNIYGGIAARLSGHKSIAVVTGLGYAFIEKGLSYYITRWLYRFSSKYHQTFIFENKDDQKLFEDYQITKEAGTHVVAGCGVPTDVFTSSSSRSQQKNKTVFSFVGRLLYHKGIKEYVEAARRIKAMYPNTEFWVIGDMDDKNPSIMSREELHGWIKSNVIVYQGHANDVKPLLEKTDCLILPSYREGMPRAVLEAMAMSLPVISTDTAGCRDAIEDTVSGYLVEVANAEDLVQTIQNFLGLTDAQRIEMGVHARHRAVHIFDSKKVANDIYDIIVSSL